VTKTHAKDKRAAGTVCANLNQKAITIANAALDFRERIAKNLATTSALEKMGCIRMDVMAALATRLSARMAQEVVVDMTTRSSRILTGAVLPSVTLAWE